MEHPLIDKKRRFSFILITSLFALWGFANDITNPMVAAFQTLLELSAAKASLIQFAFYGGYATMAIPAALFIRKYSYKRGIQLGLLLYACGAFLFIPAAAYQEFSFFCLSLYILTFGLAFLVEAIVGGSILPPLQGWIIDQGVVFGLPAVNFSFVLPLFCFVLIFFYGRRAMHSQCRSAE